MGIGKRTSKTDAMFKFSTKLFFRKDGICKDTGYVSLAIEIYISVKGSYERTREPINIKWPADKVDRENSLLLPRYRDDEDVNDYNMVIMSERAKYNEVAKVFRLTNRVLTVSLLKREVLFLDSTKSVVGYFYKLKEELYRKKMISYETWMHYGTIIMRVEEFDLEVRFDQINKKWIDRFKAYLKGLGNAHNTVWTRIKDLKAMLGHANGESTIHVEESALSYKNVAIQTPVVFLNKAEVKSLMDLHDRCEQLHCAIHDLEQKIKSSDSSLDMEEHKNSILFFQNREEYLTVNEFNILKAFLFSCFTGLRISDIYKASTSWMMSDNFLFFTMHKNHERRPKTTKIPLSALAKRFVEKVLSGKFFNLPTQQEYNRTLKDLAKLECVGIKKNLTSHVGRHTFGYLFMTTVGDVYALKEILGHSKIETTMRYAHLDEETKLDYVMKMQSALNF